ncbi:MAG: hypothetical protein ACT6Q7_10195 [Blastomonas fulva]|uniref:hypothetical protein n=2 Tax=Blastomonas fulva TaxID=1550728 RepID=UPI0040340444
MAQRIRFMLGAMAVLAISGCTHLSVVPDRSVTGTPDQALSGVPYALPMLQYDVAVSRTLTGCPEPVRIEGDAADGQFWKGSVAVELAATATPNQIAGERYLINYSKLDGALKTTNFSIEYQPGTEILKGLNVSVEDHSGEVVGNVVKAGLAVAAVASGPAGAGAATIGAGTTLLSATGAGAPKVNNYSKILPGDVVARLDALMGTPVPSLSQQALDRALKQAAADEQATRQQLIALVRANSASKTFLTCTAVAAVDVAKRGTLAATLESDGKKLKAANSALETLTKLATVRGLTKEGRTKLGDTVEQVLMLSKSVEDTQAALTAIDKRLGTADNTAWPTSFADRSVNPFSKLDGDATGKLVKLLVAAPVTALVIDAQKLADALALTSAKDLALYRTFAKPFVDAYINDDGTAKRFTSDPVFAGCSGDSAVAIAPGTCIASLTTLAAGLEAVKTDVLPDCPTGAPECRSTLAAGAQTERGDFPRQVLGRSAAPQDGLFLRPPVRAQLTICRVAASGETAGPLGCAKTAKNLVKDDKVLAPQLGQLRYFRLVNQMFSNNGLSISLTKEGAIEKFQYASSKSIAQGITAAAADAATQVAAFDKQRRDEHLKNTDPTGLLQKQIALLEAQAKYDALVADPTPDPMKAIALAQAQANVELVRAQIASLQAQTAVITARPLD